MVENTKYLLPTSIEITYKIKETNFNEFNDKDSSQPLRGGGDEEGDSTDTKNVSAFEKVLQNVGADEKYQKLLIIFYLIPLGLINAMGGVNKTLLFTTPQHSCKVEGHLKHNISLNQWKNLTIPWEKDSLGQHKLSSCFMYNTKCQHGWDFDTSEWEETPVTKFEWVCGRKDMVTTMFSLGFAGNAVGMILFSAMSDRYGRKPTFFVTLITNIVCSILVTIIPSEAAFGVFNFLLFFAFLQSSPSSLYYKILPESPRWLLSKSRISECEKYLKRISETNGRTYSEATREYLLQAQKEETQSYSLKTVMRSFTLAKHLFLTSLILSIIFIIYSGILLNIHNMEGNKAVTFLILNIFDIPGNVFGSFAAHYAGRRTSSVVIMGATCISCILAAVFARDPWVLIVFCGLSKMFASSAALVVYMQIGELFPTPLRTSAYGVTGMIGAAAVIWIPPLIAMGDTNALLPYYILFGMSLFGLLLCTFLPETVGQPLPQTINEADLIGRNQPYFSIIHKWNAHKYFDK
ncbi:Organic cation transporter 1 [Armadillidium nasatum]|uniref:Organic cation transporter 1 n=1 Tax=Armadillidium nasatum TaxID=96803 RepID=A0A5N5TGE5_9CRUS|nr:Organic cation transporter 1 [Armadillidium nasatum]